MLASFVGQVVVYLAGKTYLLYACVATSVFDGIHSTSEVGVSANNCARYNYPYREVTQNV